MGHAEKTSLSIQWQVLEHLACSPASDNVSLPPFPMGITPVHRGKPPRIMYEIGDVITMVITNWTVANT